MRLIIAGSRKITDRAVLDAALAACPWTDAAEEVIGNGEAGIATLAAQWAREKGLCHTVVVANWKRYGRSAGPRRNRVMAELGDALLVIPGDDADAPSMMREARAMDLPVFVYELAHEGQTRSADERGARVSHHAGSQP